MRQLLVKLEKKLLNRNLCVPVRLFKSGTFPLYFFLLVLLRMNSGWVYFKNSAARSSLAVSSAKSPGVDSVALFHHAFLNSGR